jgi:integrase
VTVTHLQDYKDWLLSHYKTATVNARIYGINQYMAALRTPDSPFRPVLSADVPPAFQLPSVRQQQKAFLNNVISKRDYERLKRRLKKDNCLFWYFVVRYLGATGARVGELVQIKAEHIQLGYMDLYAKGGKVRRIFFPEKLCEETLLWLRERHISTGFIFTNRYGQQISARGISSRLKFFARKYKIPPENVYPHSFRHRFAKNFLEKFNDISLLADLMGHDSIETTRIYLTKSSEEQRTLIDKIVTW